MGKVKSLDALRTAHNVRASLNGLEITTDSGIYLVRWDLCTPTLQDASQSDRERLELSPSGYGIHWPTLDEDLAIGPLLDVAEKVS